MTSQRKPYRRFRAHGREQLDPERALDEVRRLRDREDAGRERRPERPEQPAAPREPRRTNASPVRPAWWSLRGRSRAQVMRRIGVMLGLVVVVWGVAGYLSLRSAATAANRHVGDTARRALSDPGGGLLGTAQNTLVIGVDSARGRTGARADTVMVMRTNPDRGTLNYLSLPRDLRVAWDSGHIKLTEVYSHRGIAGLVKTVRSEIGIPVHHVLIVDFSSVAKMVDAVGGIEVNNPFSLQDCSYPGGITVSFRKGVLQMDGKRALQYSRVRSCDSDIERAQRQQLVVAALKSKLLSFTSLPSAPFRGARIVRAMATDMGTIDLAKFGWLQSRLKTGSRDVLATEGATISGISYQLLLPDLAGPQVRAFQR